MNPRNVFWVVNEQEWKWNSISTRNKSTTVPKEETGLCRKFRKVRNANWRRYVNPRECVCTSLRAIKLKSVASRTLWRHDTRPTGVEFKLILNILLQAFVPSNHQLQIIADICQENLEKVLETLMETKTRLPVATWSMPPFLDRKCWNVVG